MKASPPESMRYVNTKIVKRQLHRDEITIYDQFAETLTVHANVIQCQVQVSKGRERVLAMHLADLHIRGVIDLGIVFDHTRRLMREPVATIDGTNTPCAHTWRDFAGIQLCSNCGVQKED